jgi:hypothetical protein
MILHGYGLNGIESHAFDTLAKRYPDTDDEQFKECLDVLVKEARTQIAYDHHPEDARDEAERRVSEEFGYRRKIKVPNLSNAAINTLVRLVVIQLD